MHFNPQKLAVSMVVGAALISSWYPANLNAVTVASYTAQSAEAAPASQALAQATTTTAIEPVVAQPQGDLVVKTPSAIDIWLDKLIFQESQGDATLKILDVNGQYSYGCLQFQEGTFRKYALKYGLIAKGAPTESVIYNCELQKKIAKLMLAEDYSNWRAWYNSSKSSNVGLPPK